MKFKIYILILLFFVSGCATVTYPPVQTRKNGFYTPISSGLSNATAELTGNGTATSFAINSITSSQLASGTTTVVSDYWY